MGLVHFDNHTKSLCKVYHEQNKLFYITSILNNKLDNYYSVLASRIVTYLIPDTVEEMKRMSERIMERGGCSFDKT